MRLLTVGVLVVALGVTQSATMSGQEAGPKAGSLQENLRKGMPEEPSNTAEKVGYVIDVADSIGLGLAVAEVAIFGALGLALEVTGPLVGVAALWINLGAAHAEAINNNIKDLMYSGFSHGVVLGADDRTASYVKSHWIKFSPVPHSVYPEHGTKFQNAYNQALIAGYAQAKTLEKDERKAFFTDLFSRMSTHPSVTYGEDSSQWSQRTWTDYYIEAAAIFRRDHLK